MKEIKAALSEIVNNLETLALNPGAMEEALTGRELISSGELGNTSLGTGRLTA